MGIELRGRNAVETLFKFSCSFVNCHGISFRAFIEEILIQVLVLSKFLKCTRIK